MNEYVVIQSASAKVQLKSAKSKAKQYQIKFGERLCEMSHFIESWIVTAVYSYSGRGCVAGWLRDIYPDIGPDEIDAFIATFKEDHPLQSIEYTYDLVPTIATKNTYCEMVLSIFKTPVKLTLEQEMELLDIVKTDHERRTKYSRLLSWFNKFCKDYGYESRFKRDRGNEANEMAWGFCVCHGLDIDALQRPPKSSTPAKEPPSKSLFSLLMVGLFGGLYILVAVLLMLWSHQIDGFWLSGIPLIAGWAMLCVPLYLFFRNKRQ